MALQSRHKAIWQTLRSSDSEVNSCCKHLEDITLMVAAQPQMVSHTHSETGGPLCLGVSEMFSISC